MKIVIYSKSPRAVSGVQTFEKNLMKALADEHEITYLYKTGELGEIDSLWDIVDIQEDKGQDIECDLCIYSSINHGAIPPKIKAKKSIQMVHANLKAWGIKYVPAPYIDLHVSVGQSAATALLEDFMIPSKVIPNILAEPTHEKVLRIMTASRVVEGKGFERMITLAKKFQKEGRRFIWEVYGDGSDAYINRLKYNLSGVKDVIFLGPKLNIQAYMRGVDYVAQLSDNEGFCYSIHEALQLGVPCIVSDFIGARDVIQDGVNGYVIDMEVENPPITEIFENIPLLFDAPKDKSIDLWRNLLSNISKEL